MVFAIPSKGRLQEQTADWLKGCGFSLTREGGDRAYRAGLEGLGAVDVRLMSAREIAIGVDAGDIHIGVTGEDLLREVSAAPDKRMAFLRGLGFGRADVVVAAPQGWIDVSDMADLEDVAVRERDARGGPLRVATKYGRLTRRFFASRGAL